MAIPVLHYLSSPDLERDQLPEDPRSCAIVMNAEIGPERGGADSFQFVVVTPNRLLEGAPVRWGRGFLVVEEFSWDAVEHALRRLVMHAGRKNWGDSARELAKELNWEFDGYTERTG